MNFGETPISIGGNNGGDKLCDAERKEKGVRRAFHEEEPVRASDEDQSLRNDGNL